MQPAAKVFGQPTVKEKWVYFTASASTTYDQGIGLCYNRDYGTVGDVDWERDQRVEVPSTSNNRNFAGVLAEKVVFSANQTSRWVKIYEPGSVCKFKAGADTVVNTGYLTCLAGGGDNTSIFLAEGFLGRGSVIPLQTNTTVLESVQDGTGSMATDGFTLTVSDSSDWTVGQDTIVILASEDEGSSKIGAVGRYSIDTLTSGTEVIINGSSTINGATPGAALTCSYLVTDSDNDLVEGYLMDGAESGLITWVSPPNAGDTDAAPMMGGVTYINGNVTLTADFDFDLPDGTIYGERIGFILMGAELSTSYDVTIDLDTTGYKLAGTKDLTEVLTMDAAADVSFLEWCYNWRHLAMSGGTTEG